MGKKFDFVDSGFVKTCNEFVIGYNIGRNVTNDNKNAFSDHIKKCPGDKPYCKVSTSHYDESDLNKNRKARPKTPTTSKVIPWTS